MGIKNTTPCKRVGFWKDTKAILDFSGYPDPRDRSLFPQTLSSHREIVVQYLENGDVEERWFGYAYCRFECSTPDSKMGSRDFTDGTYVWPEGLAHYVRDHLVDLPVEFVQHVLRKREKL